MRNKVSLQCAKNFGGVLVIKFNMHGDSSSYSPLLATFFLIQIEEKELRRRELERLSKIEEGP